MITTILKPDLETMCKARLHTVLKNNLLVCRFFGKHNHPSHLSKTKVYQAMANRKEEANNSQQSSRSLIINSIGGN